MAKKKEKKDKKPKLDNSLYWCERTSTSPGEGDVWTHWSPVSRCTTCIGCQKHVTGEKDPRGKAFHHGYF